MLDVPSSTLWLGHAGDARDWRSLLDVGIEAVVDVAAEEEPALLPRQLIYFRCPLVDGADNSPATLSLAVDTVVALLTQNTKALLACSAGLSRSPAIAAMALARIQDRPPIAVLEELQTLKPIDINPALWSSCTE